MSGPNAPAQSDISDRMACLGQKGRCVHPLSLIRSACCIYRALGCLEEEKEEESMLSATDVVGKVVAEEIAVHRLKEQQSLFI